MSIDLKDFIRVQEKNQKVRRYRCHCDICGADRGYLDKKASSRPCKTCKYSKMDRSKIIETGRKNKGRKHTPEAIDKIRKTSKGRKHTEESKQKMSQIAKQNGNKPTPRKGFQKEEATRIKLSCSHRGISREDWNGFTTEEDMRLRNEFKRTNLVKACFVRDNFTCQKCKTRGGRLNAHHTNSWKWFPEERFDIDNLACLCIKCHKEFHLIYGKGIKAPNTKEQFKEWIS